jgi:hypothetical protein
MREVLLELAKADKMAYRELGYDRWSEANQNSKKNSPYIYAAVMDVVRRRMPTKLGPAKSPVTSASSNPVP